MATTHSSARHGPASEKGPLVAQTPAGASPWLLMIVLLLVAALMWVVR